MYVFNFIRRMMKDTKKDVRVKINKINFVLHETETLIALGDGSKAICFRFVFVHAWLPNNLSLVTMGAFTRDVCDWKVISVEHQKNFKLIKISAQEPWLCGWRNGVKHTSCILCETTPKFYSN